MLLVDGVPDPHLAGLVRGGDIESTRTVLGHVDLEILGEPSQSVSPGRRFSHLAAVLGVDVRYLGTGQVTDDHAVAVAVEERLALRVLLHHDGLPSLSPGQTGEGEPVRDSLCSSHHSDGLSSAILHGQDSNIFILSVHFIFVNRLEEHNNHNSLL